MIMFNKKNICILALGLIFAGSSIQADATNCACVAKVTSYVKEVFQKHPVTAHAVAIGAVAVVAIMLAKNCCCKKKSCTLTSSK